MLSQGRSTQGIPRFPSVLEALASLPWYNREAASLTFNFRFDQGNLASTRHRQNSKLEAGKHTHILVQQDMHVCVCVCACTCVHSCTCIHVSAKCISLQIYIYIYTFVHPKFASGKWSNPSSFSSFWYGKSVSRRGSDRQPAEVDPTGLCHRPHARAHRRVAVLQWSSHGCGPPPDRLWRRWETGFEWGRRDGMGRKLKSIMCSTNATCQYTAVEHRCYSHLECARLVFEGLIQDFLRNDIKNNAHWPMSVPRQKMLLHLFLE